VPQPSGDGAHERRLGVEIEILHRLRSCRLGRGRGRRRLGRSGRALATRAGTTTAGTFTPPPPVTPVELRARPCWPDAGANPCLLPEPSEQTALGLFEHFELGVVFVHPELIEGSVLRLLDRTTSCLDPLHGATSSCVCGCDCGSPAGPCDRSAWPPASAAGSPEPASRSWPAIRPHRTRAWSPAPAGRHEPHWSPRSR